MIKNCIFLKVLWESWILDLGFCKECIQNAFFPKSKIQDSRSQKEFLNQGGRIQDSRFKAQKKLLESKGVGFKIQDSRSQKEFLNQGGRIQDSRFKAQKKTS